MSRDAGSTVSMRVAADDRGRQPFIEGDRVVGRVVAVQGSSSFPGRSGKIADVFSGGRWQVGQQQWQESAVFVEPVNAPGSGVQRCLHVSGDLAGAVREGNVVEARVARRAGKLEVRRLVNLTTNAEATPAGVSPALLAMGAVVLFVLVGLLLWGVASGALVSAAAAFVSAAFVAALDAVARIFAAVAPYVIPIVVLLWVIARLFRAR